jgi:hypothetical protein
VNDVTLMPVLASAAFSDAEIEHLDRGFAGTRIVTQHEQVGGLDVAVGDALAMRHVERSGGLAQERDHRGDVPRRCARSAFAVDQLVERFAFQPLEHHVRHPLPVGRRVRADVTRLHDRGGVAAQLRQQRAFLNEGVLELLALVHGGVGQAVEELDRDRLVPDRVNRAVHDREAAFTDELLDAVLLGDDVAGNAERVFGGHGTLVGSLVEYERSGQLAFRNQGDGRKAGLFCITRAGADRARRLFRPSPRAAWRPRPAPLP